MPMKKIAISLRVATIGKFQEKRDSLSHDWLQFFKELNYFPVLIPNLINDLEDFLDILKIDGIILSGGDNIGDEKIRDETEKKIISYGIKNNLPIIGICRGMQVLNKYFNGKIGINQADNHSGTKHEIKFKLNGKKILDKAVIVNSYHNNLIKTEDDLGQQLEPIAYCPDDESVEGFKHVKLPILGVMWHPEREKNKLQYGLIDSFLKNEF